jgi:hypothetical protein
MINKDYPLITVMCSKKGCNKSISGKFQHSSQLIYYSHWIVIDYNGDKLPVCCSEHSDIIKLYE